MLCNLGSDDSVCSVSWAQRGNYLAVGTNLGKVQVCFSRLTSISSLGVVQSIEER